METIFTGRAAPLTQAAFDRANGMFGGEKASLWSLLTVETRGFGYLVDRRPKILFERHVFSRRTKRAFDHSDPHVSNRVAGGYVGDAGEYPRLARAMLRDRKAALESASWGLGQVMGFNAIGLGYADAAAMIDRFKLSEDEQLDAVVRFMVANPALLNALRSKTWDRVAFFYNGENFTKNDYHIKLKHFHDVYAAQGLPSVDLRATQARLAYCGFDPRGIDGRAGGGTERAVRAFQEAKRLRVTGRFEDVAGSDGPLEKAAGV